MAALSSVFMLFLNDIDGRNGLADVPYGLFVVALCLLVVLGACSVWNVFVDRRRKS